MVEICPLNDININLLYITAILRNASQKVYHVKDDHSLQMTILHLREYLVHSITFTVIAAGDVAGGGWSQVFGPVPLQLLREDHEDIEEQEDLLLQCPIVPRRLVHNKF
jgi:hypothetical protein